MTAPAPTEPRKLALATAVAAGAAALVLVVAVLPAEYGIDVTGLGAWAGFSKLHGGSPDRAVVEDLANDTGPVALYELRATWRLVSLPLAEHAGRVTGADSEERVTIPIHVPNLTSITATLTWNDTDLIDGKVTDGDMLEVSIRGPGGQRSQLAQAKNEPGRPGIATATLTLRSVPFPQENTTSGLILESAEDASSVANYTFVVRLYVAGGVNGSEARDPGQDWTLTVTGEAYELEVQKRADRAGDRVRITLAPGQAVEYKFAMSAGANMSYRWNATAPVHSDLHGDLVDDPEEFVSVKVATLAEDEGVYTAAFDGRHGWFWQNRGGAPVTITLETTGDYEVLGVV